MANNIILPFSELQAELNDEAMIDPNAVIEITENGLYNVAKYGYANVNVEGGGETWNTVFEGSVTTEDSPRGAVATLEGYSVSADSIKVTFNGTEYECNKQVVEGNTYYGDMAFSEYPFVIAPFTEEGTNFLNIITQTAGTYTLKIEELQSGGSSDFSTAEVTLINNNGYTTNINSPVIKRDMLFPDSPNMTASDTLTMVLYKGVVYTEITSEGTISVSGNISLEESNIYAITGDCTITIS